MLMAMLVPILGIVMVCFGLAFLSLSLLSAIREVFPGEVHVEQLKRAPDIKSYTELLSEVGRLKTWLSLAVVATFLIFSGALLASHGAGGFKFLASLTGGS
jgi:Na+/phosphate symporter